MYVNGFIETSYTYLNQAVPSYQCIINVDVSKLAGWIIAVIVVGALLVLAGPIICCICCGVCGAATVKGIANAGKRG